MVQTGFPSGKLYPILAKLQAADWLEKVREDIDPTVAGRPVRYWYQLSRKGSLLARIELGPVLGLDLGWAPVAAFRLGAGRTRAWRVVI
jgi:DNA-binding PadR family transcriptional regulator